MRVIVPFVELAPGVEEALKATGRTYDAYYVGESSESYFLLLQTLWNEGQGFINVEHDVLVRPETFDELEACSQPWCAYRVPYFVGNYPGMACVKFSQGLIASTPNLMGRVGPMSDASHPPRHWCRLDGWMQIVLQRDGFRQHIHEPPLGHYRPDGQQPWPSHGCVPRPQED